MKIEATKNSIQTKTGIYPKGKPFEANDEDAKWLIEKGLAKKSYGTVTESSYEKEARLKIEAAEKRKVLNAKAIELNLGVAEEIAAMTDDEIKELIRKSDKFNGAEFLKKLYG